MVQSSISYQEGGVKWDGVTKNIIVIG
jgi:hypothetical protein